MGKWPFLDQSHGLTSLKNVNFSSFWTSSFYSLEKRFFVLEYHKGHFPSLYWVKKKVEKWPFLDQNHGLTFLEKCQFLTFWSCCFFSLERLFLVLDYHKRHFPNVYCLKKKVGKMVVFGPTTLVFSTSWTSCFDSLERRFSF